MTTRAEQDLTLDNQPNLMRAIKSSVNETAYIIKDTLAPKNPSNAAGQQFWATIKAGAKTVINLAKTAKSAFLTACASVKTIFNLSKFGFHSLKETQAQNKKEEVVKQAYHVLAEQDAKEARNGAEWATAEGLNTVVNSASTVKDLCETASHGTRTALYASEALFNGAISGGLKDLPAGMLSFAQGFGSDVFSDVLSVLPKSQARALEEIRDYYAGKQRVESVTEGQQNLVLAANDDAPSKALLIHFDAISSADTKKTAKSLDDIKPLSTGLR